VALGKKNLSHISLQRLFVCVQTRVSKYRPHLLSLYWALTLYRDVPAGAGFLLDKQAVLGGAIKETPCVRVHLRAAVIQTALLNV
jgi:hypothetical protein